MSIAEQEELLEDICNDVLGYGPLEPLLARDDIADIMVNGASTVFIEVDGKMQKTGVRFRDNAQLLNRRRYEHASPSPPRLASRRQIPTISDKELINHRPKSATQVDRCPRREIGVEVSRRNHPAKLRMPQIRIHPTREHTLVQPVPIKVVDGLEFGRHPFAQCRCRHGSHRTVGCRSTEERLFTPQDCDRPIVAGRSASLS